MSRDTSLGGRLFEHAAPRTNDRLAKFEPHRVARKKGTYEEFLFRMRAAQHHVTLNPVERLPEVVPYLHTWMRDDRALMGGLVHLKAHGGRSPGPDGFSLDDLAEHDEWHFIRDIRDRLREGTYKPADERVVRIQKSGSHGFRKISIQNLDDRIVARTAMEVLQPLLDPTFDYGTLGFRPGRSYLDGIALARELHESGFGYFVAVDIRDAFPSVPVKRLVQILVKRLKAPQELTDYLTGLITSDAVKGLRQGSSLSPLLLNFYLDYFLDRPWKRRYPGWRLLRYADDILILCRSRKEAVDAYKALVEMLRPTGLRVKEPLDDAVCDLSAESPAEWMGFHFTQDSKARLLIDVSEGSWSNLENHLVHHLRKDETQVEISISAWLRNLGPAYPRVKKSMKTFIARLRNTLARQDLAPVMEAIAVRDLLACGHVSWCERAHYALSRYVSEVSGLKPAQLAS